MKKITLLKLLRHKYIFQNRPVVIVHDGQQYKYPCIALYYKLSEDLLIPVGFPCFERWFIGLDCIEQGESTLNKKAYYISDFLNYLLWQTNIDHISDVTVILLRDYYKHVKTRIDGKERDPIEWNKVIGTVGTFLINYYKKNVEKFEFLYEPKELYMRTIAQDKNNRKLVSERFFKLGVRPPVRNTVKDRNLLEEYLTLLLFVARKFDPMLVLPIKLQAYGGLREGEVVNVSRNSIKMIYGGFGRLSSIRVDLSDEAKFAKNYYGKTTFGKIKVHRIQDIYCDFVRDIKDEIDRHERLLALRGASENGDGPLFINAYGKPMSVFCYSQRLKKLFQKHFLPALKKMCNHEGTWALHAPFVEKWDDSVDPETGAIIKGEYPGAHMLRHWFTMYLITHTSMRVEEVAKWRGDSSITSMNDYIHRNQAMLDLYKKYSFRYQETVLQEVLNE